jgi:hypothetical protein
VPAPPVVAVVPGIPNNPDSDLYAKAHPNRVMDFQNFPKEVSIIPRKLMDQSQDGGWRHELDHDAESVFWLLLYWAMVVQPEKSPKEKIPVVSWSALNDNHETRERLLRGLGDEVPSNLTHSFYTPLQLLIKDLAAILVIDSHWLPASDLRKNTYYITEAFQRLILKFIIDNRGKEFMDHRVEKTFRKVHGIPASNAVSSTQFQSFDTVTREVIPVGCVYGSMNSCLFLLLCLQVTNDVEMNDIQ